METNQQPSHRSRSLKDTIYEAITAHKVKQVAALLRNTHKRINQHLENSQRSLLRSQFQSPIIQTHLSHHRYTPSPSSLPHSKSASYRSPNYLQPKNTQKHKKCPKVHPIPNNPNQDKHIFSNQIKMRNSKGRKSKKDLQVSRGSQLLARSRDRSLGVNSKSRDRGGNSYMNLSSIVEQQSSESKLMTPFQKRSKSRKSQKRKMSGDQTHKKQKKGLKEVVWRRLERCLKQPQRFHSLLKHQLLGIRLRIIRKRIIQIQVTVDRQLSTLNIFLEKGNLQCQGIQQRFQKLKGPSVFSLYSSVRSIDLDHTLHLPKLQIEAIFGEDLKLQKMITLPYCWLHFAEISFLPHPSKSRIKTKVCLQEFMCSKSQLKTLCGVLQDWECKPIGRGECVWNSRFLIEQEQFQLKVREKEGNFGAEIAGRGEQRLTCMMQFLCGLLS